MLLTMLFCLGLCTLLLIVYMNVSWTAPTLSEEKLTPFECGFEPLSLSRSPFSTRFFVLVALFLIFDIEVALLFPMLNLFSIEPSPSSLLTLVGFLLILLVGLFHEWYQGALDWLSV
nr:NADH dehydrogenase subunit 3 [Punctum randolphii]